MASFLQLHSPTLLNLKHSTLTKPISSSSPCLLSLVSTPSSFSSSLSCGLKTKTRVRPAVSVALSSSQQTSQEEGVRRLYIGNIPRNINDDELTRLVQQHGEPEIVQVMYDKYSGRSRRFGFATMKTVEDANAVVEKLDGTEVGGRKIKVNVTEKPMEAGSLSVLQADESQFVDSGHKVYVGNLAKTVTSDILKDFFSEKGINAVSAKVQRDTGTSKSTGYGFVSFSSEQEAEAAISALNNAVLEGQKIRVNKA